VSLDPRLASVHAWLPQVLFDVDGYHDSEHIYPVGYKGRYDLRTTGEVLSMSCVLTSTEWHVHAV